MPIIKGSGLRRLNRCLHYHIDCNQRMVFCNNDALLISGLPMQTNARRDFSMYRAYCHDHDHEAAQDRMTVHKQVQFIDHQGRHSKGRQFTLMENLATARHLFNLCDSLQDQSAIKELSFEQQTLLARTKSWVTEMLDITESMRKKPSDYDNNDSLLIDDVIKYDYTDALPDEPRRTYKRLRRNDDSTDDSIDDMGNPKKRCEVIIDDDSDDVILD